MTGPARVLLIGVGGYGFHYARALLDDCSADAARLVGVADPRIGCPDVAAELRARGVPTFGSARDGFSAGVGADLAVVASPIHLHVPHSVLALAHGCHVLCDKPLGATVQEADELIAARDAAGRLVWIGYQWSFSAGIRRLKRDIRAGRYGAPRRARTLCFWPRDLAYYRRNDWAGRLRDPTSGRWVLDSPLNNAQAHFMHNLLYLLGGETDRSAVPAAVWAEAGRRFPIESVDTVVCRVETDAGVELLFVGSHATAEDAGPMFEIELEEAVVRYEAPRGPGRASIVADTATGSRVTYQSPNATQQFEKLFVALRGVRQPRPVSCGPEAARAQTLCADGMHESVARVAALSADVAPGLRRCYDNWSLPSEVGLSWSVPPRRVDLRGYTHFPAPAAEQAG